MKRPTRILIAAGAGLALLAAVRGGTRPPALFTTDQNLAR
jgi:hypothetical protein